MLKKIKSHKKKPRKFLVNINFIQFLLKLLELVWFPCKIICRIQIKRKKSLPWDDPQPLAEPPILFAFTAWLEDGEEAVAAALAAAVALTTDWGVNCSVVVRSTSVAMVSAVILEGTLVDILCSMSIAGSSWGPAEKKKKKKKFRTFYCISEINVCISFFYWTFPKPKQYIYLFNSVNFSAPSEKQTHQFLWANIRVCLTRLNSVAWKINTRSWIISCIYWTKPPLLWHL